MVTPPQEKMQRAAAGILIAGGVGLGVARNQADIKHWRRVGALQGACARLRRCIATPW